MNDEQFLPLTFRGFLMREANESERAYADSVRTAIAENKPIPVPDGGWTNTNKMTMTGIVLAGVFDFPPVESNEEPMPVVQQETDHQANVRIARMIAEENRKKEAEEKELYLKVMWGKKS